MSPDTSVGLGNKMQGVRRDLSLILQYYLATKHL